MTSAAVLLALVTLAARSPGLDPEDAPRQFAPLEDALASWDVPGARHALEALRKTHAHSELTDFFAGRLAFEEGHYDEAVKLLEAAGVEDAPGSYLRLAKDTAAVVAHHEHAESEHFILSYPPGKDAVLVPYALETLERIRLALAEDLGHTPPEKVRVEVVSDARELARVSTLSLEQIRTTGTIAICKFSKLMVTSPKAVLRGYDWRDTLAHEYVHLVVSQKTRNEAPIWLQEGLAKYLESRWHGPAGMSMPPPTLALLGERVKKNTLISFARMHPSIALLPSHEDAAVAFAEVFYAVDFMYRQHGTQGLRTLLEALGDADGEKASSHGRHDAGSPEPDKHAVEVATGMSFASFEKAWLAHLKKLPYPRTSLPRSEETVTLRENSGKGTKGQGHEPSFWDFGEVREPIARRAAHLGELLRGRSRMAAAAEEFAKAYQEVGDRYPSISNKYALSLLAMRKLDEAERVLLNSLRVHPGSSATQVHLGRIYLARGDAHRARGAYLDALASDPFDPEIHLALLRAAELLKDTSGAERARKAGTVLTGWPPEEVERVAAKLGAPERDLSQTSVPESGGNGLGETTSGEASGVSDGGVGNAALPRDGGAGAGGAPGPVRGAGSAESLTIGARPDADAGAPPLHRVHVK